MNLPIDFQQQMKAQLERAYPDFLAALERDSPTSIRINAAKIKNNPNLATVPWTKAGFYLAERPFFTADPTFHAGAYYVQEASSMLLEQAIQQYVDREEAVVLDLCAAPGGKSTHLLSLLSENSLLVCNEVISSRSKILKENIQKWGSPNVVLTNNDPAHFSKLRHFFDAIVIDAPCSGEGMFRKVPHSTAEWSRANVDLCAKRQRRILADIWDSLKPNGILIYSTCTYNAQENEKNVQWLVEEYGATCLSLELDANWGVSQIDYQDVSNYRCYPHLCNGEGFSISVLRKSGEEKTQKYKAPKKNKLTKYPKAKIATLEPYILELEKFQVFQYEQSLKFFPKQYVPHLEHLVQGLRVIYYGNWCMELTKKEPKPLPAFAFSQYLNKDGFELEEVDWENAIRLQKGETPVLATTKNSWVLLVYNQISVGFVKQIKNRINNYFPKEWKIRVDWTKLEGHRATKI